MDKNSTNPISSHCIDYNGKIVIPDHLNRRCNDFNSPINRTNFDKSDDRLDDYIMEVKKNSALNSNLNRHSSMRSSKSSQNIQQYQKSKKQQQLDYYQRVLINNQPNEQQLYYSFLRLYVDSLSNYTSNEIWHMVR